MNFAVPPENKRLHSLINVDENLIVRLNVPLIIEPTISSIMQKRKKTRESRRHRIALILKFNDGIF